MNPALAYNLLSGGEQHMRWKGEQRGSLEQRSTGWYAKWREYVIVDGEARYVSRKKKVADATQTKADAQHELNRILARANGPAAVRQNCATLAQFCEIRWVPDHVEALEKSTQAQYRSLLKNHIVKGLGAMPMRDINRSVVQVWLNGIAAKKSPQTARTCLVLLKSIFGHSRDLGFWTGELPTTGVRPPKLRRVKKSFALSAEQITAIISNLTEPYRTFVLLLSYTGMRCGEAAALQWEYVNMGDEPKVIDREVLAPRTIAVRWNYSAGVMKPSPKTRAGVRNIPIAGRLLVALAAMQRPSGLVFPGASGKPIDLHNLANRQLPKACKAAGLERMGFHVFRHSLSTLAQTQGMSVAETRDVLGHSSATTTLIYTHGSVERAREVLDRIEIGGKVQ